MGKKVVLVLVDGLRPDAIQQCSYPFLREFMNKCTYTDEGKSVFPSVTLPCHMSLFHSVEPGRHGVLDNIYTRPVHPVEGLFEVLARNNKTCYFFYTWEELRDLGRPGSLVRQELSRYYTFGAQADCEMCDRTIKAIQEEQPDFVFYYTGNTDEVAHKYGWMSQEYLESVDLAAKNIEKIVSILPEDYTLFITADHGGHDRMHGTDSQEDMTIPVLCYGSEWEAGRKLEDAGLLDLAPTIAHTLECIVPPEWEGKILL